MIAGDFGSPPPAESGTWRITGLSPSAPFQEEKYIPLLRAAGRIYGSLTRMAVFCICSGAVRSNRFLWRGSDVRTMLLLWPLIPCAVAYGSDFLRVVSPISLTVRFAPRTQPATVSARAVSTTFDSIATARSG